MTKPIIEKVWRINGIVELTLDPCGRFGCDSTKFLLKELTDDSIKCNCFKCYHIHIRPIPLDLIPSLLERPEQPQ